MRRWLCFLFCLLLALPGKAAELPAAVGTALDSFDKLAASERERQAIPGLAVAVIHDGTAIWQHCYGLASLAPAMPVEPATPFGIGSISKLFASLAIVQLRDAGKLDLDDKVTRHLPWFRLQDQPHPTITLRELLLQLGGMAREPIGASWVDRHMPTRGQLIASMPEEPITLTPETHWKYSNLGYAVLGLVVEAASGETFADYVRAHILAPLGMQQTIVGPESPPAGMATGYGVRGKETREPRAFMPMGGVTPAAGVVTTVADLASFTAWLLNESDDRVLAWHSRLEMERVQAMSADWTAGQGLGFELKRRQGRVLVGHAGVAAGYAAVLEFDPASRVGVVALSNADDAALRRLIEPAINEIADAFDRAAQPHPAVADPAWRKYTGIYAFDGRRSEIALVEGRLAWQDPSAADPARSRIFLDPVAPDVFRFTDGGLAGEDLRFELNADGSVRRMSAGGNYDWKQ